MHLSYRGAVYYPPAARRRSSLLRRGQQLVQQVKDVSLQAIHSETVRKAASLSIDTDMATPFRSSTATVAVADPASQARYHSLERSLQLAYAVGDRDRIAALQFEIEQLTGWRFSRR